MFFFTEEVWRPYMEELGIQNAIDYLEGIGKPSDWVTRIPDIYLSHVFFLADGKPWYRSQCPCYEGYYLSGIDAAAKCSVAGELLPGIVWDNVCSKGYEKCPFYKRSENRENKSNGSG